MTDEPTHRSRKTKSNAKVGKLDEVHVPVRDLPRMMAFYETTVGFPRAFAHKDRMAALTTGGAMLVLDSTKPKQGPAYLGFQVQGTSEIVARLTAAGARLLQPTSAEHWGELLTIMADPEGNVLALEEGSSRAGHHHAHRTS